MILARVTGNLVSTMKHKSLHAKKMLIVEPVDLNLKANDEPFMAIDSVSAGVGDLVLINDEGSGARMVLDDPDAPIRAVIVAIVDDIQLK
jgi:microcompartment protein CcmK/EutM